MDSTIVSAQSTVLALSKTAYRLGRFLSKLDQDTKIVDAAVENLAGEVTSLSECCNILYNELGEIRSKSGMRTVWPQDIDGTVWDCLAVQFDETRQTMQELELFVQAVVGQDSSFMGHDQRYRKLNESKDRITNIRIKTHRHTENFCTMQSLMNILLVRDDLTRTDRGETARNSKALHDIVAQLQMSLKGDPLSVHRLRSDALLMRLVQSVAETGDTNSIYSATSFVAGVSEQVSDSIVGASNWLGLLESIRQEQRLSKVQSTIPDSHTTTLHVETQIVNTVSAHADRQSQGRSNDDALSESSEDDLGTDLAKAALDTGTQAFEQQDWEEADSLLQEGLRVLQQLNKKQRAFCDTFDLQYKLAVCAYHTQDSTVAEKALLSLSHVIATTDEQRKYVSDAAHLLSVLYIQTGKVEHARSECERALQIRRKLLGKQDEASLESTALLAHICVLLNNRARAKLYMAMIPEARRAGLMSAIEQSLSTKVDCLDSPSMLIRPLSASSDSTMDQLQSRLSSSSLTLPIDTRCYGPVSATLSQSPTMFPRQSRVIVSSKSDMDDSRSVTVTSVSLEEDHRKSRVMERPLDARKYSTDPIPLDSTTAGLDKSAQDSKSSRGQSMSRKEILDKVGCHPKDRIEDAVCDSDHLAFTGLLDARKGSWRSKMRKRIRPERVTALHFAALFGEINMAQRLLDSGFDVNEVPYGYSTVLTPLKFAIGARQVDMVEFLTANGARPTDSDSWSVLAGQLMNQSWLKKTMSESEKDAVPGHMIAILRILLKRGWDINAPFGSAGGTVLHQAVTFWTGSYKWDLTVRTVMTSFLCGRGAYPFQANKEGRTPYDIASASDHQELLSILSRGAQNRESDAWQMEPVELAT